MIQRMIGAAFFNRQTYEEIEQDQGALGQAVVGRPDRNSVRSHRWRSHRPDSDARLRCAGHNSAGELSADLVFRHHPVGPLGNCDVLGRRKNVEDRRHRRPVGENWAA